MSEPTENKGAVRTVCSGLSFEKVVERLDGGFQRLPGVKSKSISMVLKKLTNMKTADLGKK